MYLWHKYLRFQESRSRAGPLAASPHVPVRGRHVCLQRTGLQKPTVGPRCPVPLPLPGRRRERSGDTHSSQALHSLLSLERFRHNEKRRGKCDLPLDWDCRVAGQWVLSGKTKHWLANLSRPHQMEKFRDSKGGNCIMWGNPRAVCWRKSAGCCSSRLHPELQPEFFSSLVLHLTA